MNRILLGVLLMSIALVAIVGCSQAAAEPAAPSKGEMEGMDHKMEEEGHQEESMDHKMEEAGAEHGMEAHQEARGGQVGMAMNALKNGADVHLELVSDTPGQYILYLSDNNRKPIFPKGYKGTVAVIRPDGSEIASLPLMVIEDHLMAEGGPTAEVSQLDVRVTVEGSDLVDVLEMDFTLLYEK